MIRQQSYKTPEPEGRTTGVPVIFFNQWVLLNNVFTLRGDYLPYRCNHLSPKKRIQSFKLIKLFLLNAIFPFKVRFQKVQQEIEILSRLVFGLLWLEQLWFGRWFQEDLVRWCSPSWTRPLKWRPLLKRRPLLLPWWNDSRGRVKLRSDVYVDVSSALSLSQHRLVFISCCWGQNLKDQRVFGGSSGGIIGFLLSVDIPTIAVVTLLVCVCVCERGACCLSA